MKNKIFLYIVIYIISSCGSSTKNYKDWNGLIEGKWKLTNKYQTNYPTIEFTKGGAVFNSLADTIYGFSCRLHKLDLILNDGVNPETHNKIIKLTQDSLIFKNLLEHTTQQVYFRKK